MTVFSFFVTETRKNEERLCRTHILTMFQEARCHGLPLFREKAIVFLQKTTFLPAKTPSTANRRSPSLYEGGYCLCKLTLMSYPLSLSEPAAGGDGDAVDDLFVLDEEDLAMEVDGGAAMPGDEEHLVADLQVL